MSKSEIYLNLWNSPTLSSNPELQPLQRPRLRQRQLRPRPGQQPGGPRLRLAVQLKQSLRLPESSAVSSMALAPFLAVVF